MKIGLPATGILFVNQLFNFQLGAQPRCSGHIF